MTKSITPPKLATLLLRLFAGEPDFPQIEGDLSEEFHKHLLASGPDVARRSYRREAFRNMWALAKRPSTVGVVAAAALSIGVWVVSVESFSHWLTNLDFSGSAFALNLSFIYLFNATIALMLGVSASRFLREREQMLRVTFTGFYLLYVLCGYLIMGPLVINRYFALSIINWSLALGAFWIGSAWITRRRLRRLAV